MAILITVLLYASLAAESWVIPSDIRQAVVSSKNDQIGQRMSEISEAFIGIPYVLDPMGESVGIDVDPIIRYDAFDCLTYVEEVLALSLSFSPESASMLRQQLRYLFSQNG